MRRSLFRASLAAAAWVVCHPLALANEDARAKMAPSPVGRVLVLPWDSPPGAEHVGPLRADIAHEDGFRVYRIEFGDHTYWAHRVLDGRARPVAFVPNEGRFVDVLPELKVVLNDPDDLEDVINAAGAVDGKAYPPGWALLRLRPEVNPAQVAEALSSHPSVAEAEVRLRPPRVRSMQARDGDSAHKDSPTADLFVGILGFSDENLATGGSLDVSVLFQNSGAAASSETTVAWALNTSPDFTGDDELSGEIVLPPIAPGGDLEMPIRLDFGELSDTSEGASYYGMVEIADSPEEPARLRLDNVDVFGFTLGAQSGGSSTIRARCDQVGSRGRLGSSGPDPFVDEQWNLDNTGQAAFARSGGVAGEDLNMDGVIADSSAPTGAGVRIAVVDTGLEICHPDLEANVEPGKSWNFLAPGNPAGSRRNDPFYASNTGDHGTSVAGVAAAASDNGIGGRGVAPDVLLRGYNFLPATWSGLTGSYFDSLGMSRADPDSSAVDIFNMSFGTEWAENAAPATVDLFRHGVEKLRGGLGAIYVKAAGNGFEWWSCSGYLLPVHDDIGCRAANADSSNNLPYLIVVGGLDANGWRADYASAGANLWISAPAGEYGRNGPAIITTDQMGLDTGYSGGGIGLAVNASLNPNGNYVSTFNGTSSAAPNASGAVALLLEARPDLTWRDVKHILARTARRVDDPGIGPVERLLSGGYYTLQHGWTENAAGHRFHNWYGFGAVDVDAALNLAAVHESDSLGEYRETLPYARDALALSIPDSNLDGARDRLRVDDLHPDARVESATATVRVDHPFPHDLSIELISPAGTRSVLNPAFNDVLSRRSGELEWDLLSNAFYGEDPTGDWELVVVDAASRDEGQLTGWDLRLGLGSHAAGIHPAGGVSDDHGNIRRMATGIGISGSVGGVLEIGGDIDYFRIVVTSATTIVLSTEGSTDTFGVLEDEDGVVLASDSHGGPGANFRIVHRLMPGTYYLRVQGQDRTATGDYTILLQQDSTGPVQARAYAIAPETGADRSWVRIRCEGRNDCPVTLDCTDEAGVSIEAALSNDLPAGETEELYAADILRLSGATSWTRRLACLVRSPERLSAQVWTESGSNDVLVNNTAILDSEVEGGINVARVYSLPAPNSPSGNLLNLRIRCESAQACDDVRLRCFDDNGNERGRAELIERADRGIANGRIDPWSVAHLQADHVGDIIQRSTWDDLRMSCEVESSRPISVQILTRSGGSGGPLVNNTALSLGR